MIIKMNVRTLGLGFYKSKLRGKILIQVVYLEGKDTTAR